jgi:hypothetical protein
MATEELTDRLERTAGRTAPPRASSTRPRAHSRTRRNRRRPGPIAAGVLIAVLAAAWFLTSRSSSPSEAPAPSASTVPTFDLGPLTAMLGEPEGCDDASVSVPELKCEIEGVRVEARLVAPADVDSVYATATGASVVAQDGQPACEHGKPDNRAWSRAAAPKVAVGRYLCRIEDGHAAMWWSEEQGLVAHAVASDGDLARLFAWWRAHLDE